MSSYDYSIMYKPGTNIIAADAMSRLLLKENLQVKTPGCIIHLIDHLNNTAVDSADIRWRTSKDPVLLKVYQAVRSETYQRKGPLYSAFHTKRYELNVENECLLWRSQVITLHTLWLVMKELQQCQSGIVKIKALARNYLWWPGMDANIEEKVNRCYTCQSSRTSPARAPQHP